MRYALRRTPTLNELKKAATIISWNLWQMDGLTYGPPLCDIQEEMNQLPLFDFLEKMCIRDSFEIARHRDGLWFSIA